MAGPGVTELWLVRHGQTEWNLRGRYQGQADIPLNETGLQQARDLAAELAGIDFQAVYSSDLQRARQTAEQVASLLSLPVKIDPRLREINQGELEGMVYAEAVSQYAELFAKRTGDPAAWRAPGGESVLEVAARVAEALDEICLRHSGQRVLVIAHGLCLATFACTARGIPLGEVYRHIPDNAVPVVVTCSNGSNYKREE